MEFPLLNYLIYLVSLIFGYAHWYGRLINLMISSAGIYYFYLVIRRFFNQNTAFLATILLLTSIWLDYSRKIMPDTFSISLVIIGFYYGLLYLTDEKSSRRGLHLFLYAALTSLGVLSKLPNAYLGVIFILPLASKAVSLRRKVYFLCVSLVMKLVPLFWYGYWVPYLNRTYGFSHFFMGYSLKQGMTDLLTTWPGVLRRFYEDALGYPGFLVFVFGFVMAVIKKEKLLLRILAITLLAFLMVVLKGGETFSRHSYYIVPFVPVMALVAVIGLQYLKLKHSYLIVMVVSIIAILNQQHDFRIRPAEKALENLESKLDTFSGRDELFLINSGLYPTPMYFAHRRGWVEPNERVQDMEYLQSLKSQGLKYVIILKKTFGSDITLPLPVVMDNEDYRIYSVSR